MNVRRCKILQTKGVFVFQLETEVPPMQEFFAFILDVILITKLPLQTYFWFPQCEYTQVLSGGLLVINDNL